MTAPPPEKPDLLYVPWIVLREYLDPNTLRYSGVLYRWGQNPGNLILPRPPRADIEAACRAYWANDIDNGGKYLPYGMIGLGQTPKQIANSALRHAMADRWNERDEESGLKNSDHFWGRYVQALATKVSE